MPDSNLPKPTPPAPVPSPVNDAAAPLKMSAQGEIVIDTSQKTDVPSPDVFKPVSSDKPTDDMTVPPSAFQTAPAAPLPSPTTLPTPATTSATTSTTVSTTNPLLVTAPAATFPNSPLNNSSTNASLSSKTTTSAPTPPPTTLTALSSMTSATVPPTPPPPPQAPANSGPKTQPVLATKPKKSLPLPLLLGLAALVLLVVGVAGFFMLRPKTTSVTNSTNSNRNNTTSQDQGSDTGSSGSSGNSGSSSTNSATNNKSGSGSNNASGTTTNSDGTTTSSGEPVVLEYWGLWEPTELVQEVLSQYETSHPGISVRYTKQSYQDYRERLQTAVASGNGPDIFRFHASWTPMLKNELAAMPATVMSTTDFSNAFYPIATTQLQQNGQVVGIPLMYDGLVLYYNKDIFKTAGVDPPQTWADVRTLAGKLAIKNSTGGLQRGGIAMGNVANVDHFSDILGVLLLQNGADLTRPNSNQTRDALLFYTNFVTKDKVWDDQLPGSTVAFARGDVAMMFAPSWRAYDIAAQNPTLQFGTVPLPKLSENRLSWATYWAEGVSQQSKHKTEAWDLLKYLSSSPVLKSQYAKAGGVRSFGEIYPRKDMASDLASTEVVKSVLEDAPFAKNWYLNSATHDNGLNDKLIQYYADAVNGIISGKRPEDVLVTLEQGTSQVLGQYDIGPTL